jgi:hypothetical protein
MSAVVHDRYARERLAELGPSAHRCLGCDAPLHERTPGCRSSGSPSSLTESAVRS